MIANPFLYRTQLSDVEAMIVLGLRKYGRRATFMDILMADGVFAADQELFEIALALEVDGFIESVSYQAPATIRAELTKEGAKAADSLEDERWFSKSLMRAKAFH